MRAFHPFPRPLLAGRKSYRHPPPPPIVGHPRSLAPPISNASCHPSTLSLRSYAKASASNLPPVTVRTATTLTGQPLDRATFDNMLRRRMFYTPSFEIYGGVSGLFDYGPPGCALQQGIIDVWRKHFVLEEGMLEVDCSVLTPAEVLVTSGHVAKFADAMCKDPENGELFRADHFIRDALERRLDGNKKARGQQIEKKEEDPDTRHDKKDTIIPRVLPNAAVKEYQEILAKLDNYNTKELGELIRLHNLKNPATRAQPLPPVDFNLMFSTRIGPNNHLRGYLRPETAQGQLLNFSKLLNFNQQRMPFASASIGKSYRNEISPRSGLLRVREFLMAEIEHFVDPQGGKKHPRFNDVKDVELVLLNKKTQLSGETQAQKVTIGEAVADGTVDNETLGYFLARIQLFLEKIGMDQTKIRFRQHLANEMAHYAVDCWDAELLTSYGWIECVGCADRSAYDLSVHAKKTGASLTVRQQLTEPMEVTEWEIELYRKKFGPHFQKDGRAVEAALVATTQSEREELAKDLRSNGSFTIKVDGVGDGTVTIHEELVGILQKTRAENVREFIPNVIEPSFGIGRILYALMEHCYWHRGIEKDDNGEDRGVLSFPPIVAPTKVVILPLSNNYAFRPFCHELSQKLGKLGISNRIDDSKASIGKRYSRNDELGTPLGITIDFQTAQDRTFTLRDRDSTKQVRADEDGILAAICSIVYGNKTFRDIECELPTFLAQQL
ncbi:putative glycyl-tRNA synthetase [Rosellinia necatrix]|uniref:glycine--tRNA ligase n=1 Tax=Rosellinia necatrix TaxID=77044 RepID=A0A1S7UMW6_ROSNE|nr:putative glycyl-tRNA synthetase [Rosellinia necatrix]